MDDSRSFSNGVDRLLDALRPYSGSGSSSYPKDLDATESRRRDDESDREWFVRMVDRFCAKDPTRVAVEDNLAVFARLRWERSVQVKRLEFVSIQALYATCDLGDVYSREDVETFCLRLDVDCSTLGEPFSHPLAHVHVDGSSSPRFSLDGGNCGNVVVDFLEFLYRSYVPEKWWQWVCREWEKDFAKSAMCGATDPLPTIRDAFRSNQFDLLKQHSGQIERLKKLLRRRKDDLFDCHLEGTDRLLLEYPLAR